MGYLEEIMQQNQVLIKQNEKLLEKLGSAPESKDTSWIDIDYILNDLNISVSEFHSFWKDHMPFLFRGKGKGSKYRAAKHKYEEWKVKWEEHVRSNPNIQR